MLYLSVGTLFKEFGSLKSQISSKVEMVLEVRDGPCDISLDEPGPLVDLAYLHLSPLLLMEPNI